MVRDKRRVDKSKFNYVHTYGLNAFIYEITACGYNNIEQWHDARSVYIIILYSTWSYTAAVTLQERHQKRNGVEKKMNGIIYI